MYLFLLSATDRKMYESLGVTHTLCIYHWTFNLRRLINQWVQKIKDKKKWLILFLRNSTEYFTPFIKTHTLNFNTYLSLPCWDVDTLWTLCQSIIRQKHRKMNHCFYYYYFCLYILHTIFLNVHLQNQGGIICISQFTLLVHICFHSAKLL